MNIQKYIMAYRCPRDINTFLSTLMVVRFIKNAMNLNMEVKQQTAKSVCENLWLAVRILDLQD